MPSHTMWLSGVSMRRHLETRLQPGVLLPTLSCRRGPVLARWGLWAVGGDVPQKTAPMGIAHPLCADGTIRKRMKCLHIQQQDPVVPSKKKKSPGLVVTGTVPGGIWVNRGWRNAVGGLSRRCNSSEWSEGEMLKTGKGRGGEEGETTREAGETSILPASRRF